MKYDLTDIIANIQSKDKISISYIQRTFSFGFLKSGRLFNELVEKGYVTRDGKVIKEKVIPGYKGVKAVFLDVDGVLNCHSTKDRCGGYIGIDDKKVALLKEIVDATGAIIILVSSWKEWWTPNPRFKMCQGEMANYLDAKLAKQGLVIRDKTIDYNSPNRARGIIWYIEMQKDIGVNIDNYIVLDDELFDYKQTHMTKRLIQTSFYADGLTKKHKEKAIAMLSTL